MSDQLQVALHDLIFKLVNCYYMLFLNGSYVDNVEIDVNISEYNSPSFSDKIETILPLYQNKVLARKDILDELFGDNKTPNDKDDMLKRANEEFGGEVNEEHII
jgi:hypothetical protein